MSARDDKRGFALPTVLVVVAVLALVFLTALTGLNGLNAEARTAQEGVGFDTAAANLEARIAYLALTRPLTPNALVLDGGARGQGQALSLDGATYGTALYPALRLQVQDEAGLINLDQLPRDAIERLFSRLASPGISVATLADRWGDYVDADDLKRTRGAEASDYAAAGLPPPPNRPLRAVAETAGLLGWAGAIDPATWRAWRDRMTADPLAATLNVDTASAPVLAVVFGLSDQQAQIAVAKRAGAPFASIEDLGRAAGVALVGDAERRADQPNNRFALTVSNPKTGQVYRTRIVYTPMDPDRPVWFVEAREERGAAAPAAALDPSHELP